MNNITISYEGKMLEDFKMPTIKEVEEALLKSLFKHNGVIKEFGSDEKIVDEIANDFNLNQKQRNAYLETIYKKEKRVKKSFLWHRLLFRAADKLAKVKMISRPTKTIQLTNKKEWMLTEDGYDEALKILGIPAVKKEFLPVKSYEIQKIVKKMNDQSRPQDYDPFESNKEIVKITKETKLRNRGFRQAIIEAYSFKCSVCGMKINSPDNLQWEVQAAHIVPRSLNGRDDIWNGLALCRLHHWAFDVGWFTLQNNFKILASKQIQNLSDDFGKMDNYEFMRALTEKNIKIILPNKQEAYPHQNAIQWHRENVFAKR